MRLNHHLLFKTKALRWEVRENGKWILVRITEPRRGATLVLALMPFAMLGVCLLRGVWRWMWK